MVDTYSNNDFEMPLYTNNQSLNNKSFMSSSIMDRNNMTLTKDNMSKTNISTEAYDFPKIDKRSQSITQNKKRISSNKEYGFPKRERNSLFKTLINLTNSVSSTIKKRKSHTSYKSNNSSIDSDLDQSQLSNNDYIIVGNNNDNY